MRTPKSDWTDLFLAFRMCLDPRKLWLALRGAVLSVILVGLLLALLAAAYRSRGIGYTIESVTDSSGRTVREIWKRQTFPIRADRQPTGRYREADTDVLRDLVRGHLADSVRATRNFVVGVVCSAQTDLDAWLGRRAPTRYSLVHILWLSEPLSDALLVVVASALVLLLIWSYYGGAILRLAAVEYALGERIALKSVLAYTRRKHHCFYGPPLVLIAVILVLGVCVAFVGLVAWNLLALLVAFGGLVAAGVAASVVRDRTRSAAASVGVGVVVLIVAALLAWLFAAKGWRIPVLGELTALILTPLIFLAGFLVALVEVWLLFGTPLMAGAVASQDCDLFDAWSRSYHYLFAHPWRYAFYVVVALAYGVACLAFVYALRLGTEWAALLPFSVGLVGQFEGVYHILVDGATAAGYTLGEGILAFALAFARFFLDILFLSFAVVYACVATAIAYALLRLRADGTPISEVHLEPSDKELLQPPAAPVEKPAA